MQLFVGLGNPGPEHAGQRHNIGFMAVDEIARAHSFSNERKRFQGATSEGVIGGKKVIILKPATFMNESGRSVGEAVRFYKLEPEGVTVFYDEIDLAAGKLRVKQGGGAAGHNGIRSIAAHIGEDFYRVRIGVGHPGERDRVVGHVLRDFSKEDKIWRDKLLDAIGEAAPLMANGDPSGFTTRIANIINPPIHKPKPEPEQLNSTEVSGDED